MRSKIQMSLAVFSLCNIFLGNPVMLPTSSLFDHLDPSSPSSASCVVGAPANVQRHRRLPGVSHLDLHHRRVPPARPHLAQVQPQRMFPEPG